MGNIAIENITVERITPEALAEAFWAFGSDGQAEFFHHLHKVVKEDHKASPASYSLGEMQWLYMHSDIKTRSKEAYEMYLAFCAFAFDYWPRKET